MNKYYHLKYKNDPRYIERNRERAREYYRMHGIEILSKRKNRVLADKSYAAHESARAY
ncbi:MAG: hypothetical protein PXY39_05940 [archaeon]|nr:hypothetical protein [archaeon]